MAGEDDTLRRSCAENRLANNVVGGDPRNAPRCLARTRRGTPCQGPAMRNKHGEHTRCRLHGGARMPEGRARAAILKHDGFATETVEMRAALRRSRDEAEKLVARLVAEANAADDTIENGAPR